jgi:hypothetical protein
MPSWIQTRAGKKLTPQSLVDEQVGGIDEIAWSLAHNFRFTRQTLQPYSVAEHCVRGARLLPRAFAGAFLLHELSEVYLPDVPAPIKPHLCFVLENGDTLTWVDLERQHTQTILRALGLHSLWPLIECSQVRQMDLAMLALEKRDLMAPEPESWGLTVEPPHGESIMQVMKPDEAAAAFIYEYNRNFGAIP